MLKRVCTVLLACLFVIAGSRAEGQSDIADFRVIVHPTNPRDEISAERLSRIYLKKITKWSDGQTVLPLDQVDSAVSQRFCESVHGKTLAKVKTYWQQQIFAGREIPPPQKRSDEDVVAYVEDNPAAIGYVSGKADLRSVKVLKIVE